MSKKTKALEIDGIFGSELRDTQGETLSIEGADISELEAGRGRFNDNHGKGFFNAIGQVTKAKKIFKRDDCDDDRQRYYWDKIKTPYIYGRGFLYSDDDHPNARACAAILRNIHRTDSPLQLKMSVEGGVISRGVKDPSLLARTKIIACALTFTPANNATLVEPLNLNKSANDWQTDLTLIKSVLHLAQTDVPSFRHIARDASATKVQANLVKLVDLMKDLGIEGDIAIPSKQKILQKALEQKIQFNLEQICESVKFLAKNDEIYLKDCSCGAKVTTKNAKYIGTQKGFADVPDMKLYNCPTCQTTISQKVKPKSIEKGDVIDLFPKKTIENKQKVRAQRKNSKDPLHQPTKNRRILEPNGHWTRDKGISEAGADVRHYLRNKEDQKEEKSYGGGAYKHHSRVLDGLKTQQKPNLTKSELEKASIKNAIGAAATGAAMAMAPSQGIPMEPRTQPPTISQAPKMLSIKDVVANTAKQYPLLGAISSVESQNGKNLNHKMMNNGIHKGMTAGGPYGMMPHSAAFILQKDPELAKKYPKLVAAAKDVNKNHQQFTELLNKDPQAAADFAVAFYKRNKGKTKNDSQLTYSWLNGLKGSWNKYKEGGQQALDEHPYVQKVMTEYKKSRPQKVESKEPVSKSMTAGYGGGGSPGALIGGGVLQSENLDDGRSKMKYVTCDNCGKEQVHSKFQVKCRECGHGMSFSKLYDAMRGNK